MRVIKAKVFGLERCMLRRVTWLYLLAVFPADPCDDNYLISMEKLNNCRLIKILPLSSFSCLLHVFSEGHAIV